MPVFLPPISRRVFLRQLAAGCGAAALGRPALAADSVTPEMWALLADPHLAADRHLVWREVNMTDNFRAVTREILREHSAFAGLLINGDCAFNKGQETDYENFLGLCRVLREHGLPLRLTLGNHDHRANFWRVMAADKTVPEGLPDRQVAVAPGRLANWFLLDSLDRTNSTPGLLGAAQLRWLARTLDARPHHPAIVVAHHNLDAADRKSALLDTEQLLEIIEPRRQVKAYIFGHTHHWTTRQTSSGLHLINLPPVAYLFQKGDPNGWVRARVFSDRIQIEPRCLDRRHPAHAQLTELRWRT